MDRRVSGRLRPPSAGTTRSNFDRTKSPLNPSSSTSPLKSRTKRPSARVSDMGASLGGPPLLFGNSSGDISAANSNDSNTSSNLERFPRRPSYAAPLSLDGISTPTSSSSNTSSGGLRLPSALPRPITPRNISFSTSPTKSRSSLGGPGARPPRLVSLNLGSPNDALNGEDEKKKLQAVIVKLQEKLHNVTTELEKSKIDLEKVIEAKTASEEVLETLTIDKEVLDEQNHSLFDRIDTIKHEYDLLAKHCSELESRPLISDDMLRERNNKLEAALVRLKEVSSEKEQSLIGKITTLSNKVGNYKAKYEAATVMIDELKLQLDSLLESTALIESLSEKNLVLSEQNTKLRQTVEELEDLRDLANDLEEAHLQSERELKNDIKALKKVIEKDNAVINQLDKQVKYFENYIFKLKKQYEDELNNSRNEISVLLTQPNSESLQHKIDELSDQVNKLKETNLKTDLVNKILNLEMKTHRQVSIGLESLIDAQAKKIADNIKFSSLLLSIINLIEIIGKILSSDRFEIESQCRQANFLKSLLQFKSLFKIAHSRSRYFVYLFPVLEEIFFYFKDLCQSIFGNELTTPLNDVNIQTMSYMKKIFHGESVIDMMENIFLWEYYSGKNIEEFQFILNNYAIIANVCLCLLGSINKFIENDVLLAMEANNNSDMVRFSEKFDQLNSNFQKLRNFEKNLRKIVQIRSSKGIEFESSVFVFENFIGDMKVYEEAVKELLSVAEKIEYEDETSFTLELEEKEYTLIFAKFLSDSKILDNYNKTLSDTLVALENVNIEVPTKQIELKINNLSKETAESVDVVNLKNQLEQMVISSNEKDQFVSELRLKIDLLQKKLGNEVAKDEKLSELTVELDKLLKQAESQKLRINELSILNVEQSKEIQRKLKSKDLLGDFASIYEEKQFLSKAKLISEILATQDLVKYLLSDRKATFGISLNSQWLERKHGKNIAGSNGVAILEVSELSSAVLSLHKKTPLLLLIKAASDEKILDWTPRSKLQNYKAAQFCELMESYRSFKKEIMLKAG